MQLVEVSSHLEYWAKPKLTHKQFRHGTGLVNAQPRPAQVAHLNLARLFIFLDSVTY